MSANVTSRREVWESRSAIPLVVLGVVFMVGYSVMILVPTLRTDIRLIALVVLLISWVAFIVDYVVRLCLTRRGRRWRFVRTHPIEFLAMLLPVFRAFRVLSLQRKIPYFHRRNGAAVRAEVVTYAAGFVVIFVYFMSLATLQVERDAPGATITSFGNAIWWACVTLATVGYGDVYPVTVLGRVYAVALMVGGVAIVGTASAVVISYIGDRVRKISGSNHND